TWGLCYNGAAAGANEVSITLTENLTFNSDAAAPTTVSNVRSTSPIAATVASGWPINDSFDRPNVAPVGDSWWPAFSTNEKPRLLSNGARGNTLGTDDYIVWTANSFGTSDDTYACILLGGPDLLDSWGVSVSIISGSTIVSCEADNTPNFYLWYS